MSFTDRLKCLVGAHDWKWDGEIYGVEGLAGYDLATGRVFVGFECSVCGKQSAVSAHHPAEVDGLDPERAHRRIKQAYP